MACCVVVLPDPFVAAADLSSMLMFSARFVSVRGDLVRVRASRSELCLLDPWKDLRISLNLCP